MIYETPRYLYSGDQYLTVEIGDEMTLQANFLVIGLDRAINNAEIKGLIETFPGWRSVLVSYDSLVIHTDNIISEIKKVVDQASEVKDVPSRIIELPVKAPG